MNKAEPILEVQNISKVFPDGKTGLDGIDFSIGQGDFTVITGANGSGKTLLMSIIADLEKPSSGKIIKNAPVGLVFQEADSQILGETVLEDTLYGLRLSGKNKKEAAFLALEALKKTGLESKKEQSARLLSGGEKRRLAVSAILALNREIIILDEPYANLDWPGVKQVNKILLNLKGQNRLTLAVSEAKRFVQFSGGVNEESNRIKGEFTLFMRPEAPIRSYEEIARSYRALPTLPQGMLRFVQKTLTPSGRN